jgi:glycosyltransferase involved in cell wall biosynthesis
MNEEPLERVMEPVSRRAMKDVLFIAYFFPPLGGGGVQRSIKFVRYLPDLGYRPLVVTRPAGSSADHPPSDRTLEAGIPAGTEVLRVAGPEPARDPGWRGRWQRWLRRPDSLDRWWIEGAVSSGLGAAASFDLIFATMSPFESGEVAGRLARDLGKPWVADLRDPWALDEWRVYPTALHRRLELRRMSSVLSSADAIVMNTREAARAVVARFPNLADKPVVAIPNGFDASDFAGPPPERSDAVFRIVHAGAVHSDPDPPTTRALRRLSGGSARGLDIGTRSHVHLLDAVGRLLAVRPELESGLEVHLAGALTEDERAALPDGVIRARGYLPHHETIALLRSADLLFLPMHDLSSGLRSRIVPGKTYEYLASRTPILAAVPDGDARDLLTDAGNAFPCRPEDVAAMARIIEEQLERKASGDPAPAPREDVLRRFERRHLTSELAALFDHVLGGRKAAPEPPAPERTLVAP